MNREPDSQLAGRVQTILGPIDPSELGVCLTHEHVLIDRAPRWGGAGDQSTLAAPTAASRRKIIHEPITLENLAEVQYDPWNCLDNYSLIDVDSAIRETMEYKLAGGSAIVDLGSIGLGRDPMGLARVARATGLQIIMGAGYHAGRTHPPELASMSVDQIAEGIIRDITEGVDGTGMRSGIIGQLGCTWPLMDTERKTLQASVKAQQATGVALNINPGYHPASPAEIMDVLHAAGARPERVVMGALERTVSTWDQYLGVAQLGTYLEFSTFGWESSYIFTKGGPRYDPWNAEVYLPNDALRVDTILRLIDEGYLERIMVGHDTGVKLQLTQYGGAGYAHILRRAVPLMRHKGMTEDQIRTILVDNPRRFLTFA